MLTTRPQAISLELEDLPDTHTRTEKYIDHLEKQNGNLTSACQKTPEKPLLILAGRN
ncbi:hypothetical protein NX722_14105 [Endozoicomonas gorgoniicola]|uniref:Uncharacterized protein n=1 Tax=Endozoicomonas gorgoniicola TaxID=1234144 RepID=A0ABT3MWJ7_9GAMM|nr:hypothetical protein [Endozoicomonas gorgoniicola]MCW7553743.1 hypothetical protein [Endozoicomonas gorgoniicola]